MLDFSDSLLEQTLVHFIGSSDTDELILSDKPIDLGNELLRNLLRDYFLSHFRSNGFYSFAHESSLELNELFAYCSAFFEGTKDLVEVSQAIARHLKHVSTHPNIKEGELYVVSLRSCVVDDEMADAIGIFKSETKDKFLKINRGGAKISVSCEFGTNPKRLDKGCFIFNTEKELGYKLSVIDNTNRDEAKYWIDDFLRVKVRNDNFYKTKSYIDLCKGFVEEVFNPANNVDRADQAVMLNKTRDYFKMNDTFEQKEFEAEVMEQPEIIDAFRDYKKRHEAELGYEIHDGFKISADATKQSQKYLRSVIKLDKNFHIYIHGERQWVEKGYDTDKQLSYYKLYFEKES
jgi:hypothetical protein